MTIVQRPSRAELVRVMKATVLGLVLGIILLAFGRGRA
jgi:preprotein translocase subunit Sss1